jgi:hypothetical protein
MADLNMPDVLTPEQMAKLGGAAHPDDLPDTMTPDQMERATEKPRSYPPTEDEKLGIDSPLASPRGVVFNRGKGELFRRADKLGTEQQLPADYVPERGLIREDPAMDIATTVAGGGAGKLAGKGVAKLSKVAAKIVEPAVAGMATSALQGGSLRDIGTSGVIGGALGVPGAALGMVRQAPAAVEERLTRAVTGGVKSKAAKQVAAGGALNDVLEAHPDLKHTIASAGDPATKFNATSSTLGKLTAANDVAFDAIQAEHQGIPLDPIAKKIQAVAQQAHAEGDEVLEKAAASAIENLQRYGDVADKRGLVATATQVRGVRNNLARKVQALNPTLGPSEAQAAADQIKRAINEGIEDVAAKTKGVDVAALKERNKQIAVLMPVQRTLRQQVIDAGLKEGQDPLAEFIHSPKHVVAGLVNAGPAKADLALANASRLQSVARGADRLGNKATSLIGEPIANGLPGAAAARLAQASKPRIRDTDYAALVAQKMKNGLSLQEAIDATEAR